MCQINYDGMVFWCDLSRCHDKATEAVSGYYLFQLLVRNNFDR